MSGPRRLLTTVWLQGTFSRSGRSIENVLNSLSPRPVQIQVSRGAKSVTVCHTDHLSPHTIRDALAKAGFDLIARRGVADSLPSRPPSMRRPSKSSRKQSLRHKISTTGAPPGYDDDEIFPLQKSDKFIPSKDQHATDEMLSVTLSVGGMTCAACSSAVIDILGNCQGVSQANVNLLGMSATMNVERKELVEVVVKAVIDGGFTAEVFKVVPLKGKNEPERIRTITLQVDGLHCTECPKSVMASLKPFSEQITIIKPLETLTDPTLRFSYEPDLPNLTVRHIISCIAAAKSPPYNVSIYEGPSIEEIARTTLRRNQRNIFMRLMFTILVSIPTFIIGTVYMVVLKDTSSVKLYFMKPMWAGNVSRFDWVLLFLATPVMFYSANIFHRRALKEIFFMWRKGSKTPILQRFTRFGSMNLLVSTAVSVAYFSSIALMGLAAAEPASPGGQGDTTTYFDSVVYLTLFLLAGHWLELYGKSRAGDAISSLKTLFPSETSLVILDSPDDKRHFNVDDGEKCDDDAIPRVEQIKANLLEVGDIVRVENGNTPPADGRIQRGETIFDESSLTGESALIKKHVGDPVALGTTNKGEAVDVQITAIGENTMLSQMIQVVREGLSRRAPVERFATHLLGYFVPVSTLLAILTWVIWMSLGFTGVLPDRYLDIKIGGWPVWSLRFSIAVFVVACPCGIGLAAPTALFVGSGLASKFGILARGGGEAFQEMADIDTIVFDKTGTLTEGGERRVSDAEILPLNDDGVQWNPQLVLGIAAEIESLSTHPFAVAIRNYCRGQKTLSVEGAGFEETSGLGIKACFAAHRCTAIIGNEAWMIQHGVSISKSVLERLSEWKNDAKSVVLLAIRQETDEGAESSFKMAATFAVNDSLRPEARHVIATFHRWGMDVWMISGDNPMTARAVAREAGIPLSNVLGGVLPHEKAEKILWLQENSPKRKQATFSKFFGRKLNERCIVAMVGDGTNDAPALSASDVGIAIGSGSEVAISSASFVLVSSNLKSLLTLRHLSRKIFNRVKFNFAWAIVYNLIAVPVAAGVLYPFGHIRLSAVWASVAMALSDVSVIGSSLLLKLYKEPTFV